MSILVDELKNSDKSFAVANNKVVVPWIEAESCEKKLPGASITLLSLKAKGLIKTFGNVDV